MAARVALAVSAGAPETDTSNELVIADLARLGVTATTLAWDGPTSWSDFDLVVIRSVLDYSERRDEFLRWARSVPKVLNPPDVLAWNSDKHYLKQLAEAGVPVVPTTWLEPEQQLGARGLHTRFPSLGDFVIKPAIGAGSQDTGRYTSVDGRSRGVAIDHALWLLESGRSVLVQRYVQSVDVSGERALFFIDGEYSHALHKEPMLTRSGEGAQAPEKVRPTEVTEQDRAVARSALDAACSALHADVDGPLLYGRVDLISGDGDAPLVLELELTKSQMGASQVPQAASRLAEAIAKRVVR